MANLKELFPEFYQEKIYAKDLSERSDNIIILDTNYLLEIIKSPTIISEQYVEAVEKVIDNIYIPYLVALEFNFNKSKRKKLKMQEINNYKNDIRTNIEEVKNKINDINFVNNDNKEEFSRDIIKLTEEYTDELQLLIDKNIESMVTKEQDKLYNKLIKMIENKIGDQYTQEWITSVEEEGQHRFENNIPPGFDDKDKGDSDEATRVYNTISYQKKFADLIIWKDILNFSKECTKKGKKVIFVTDDGKSNKKKDLLYKVNSLIVGPNIYMMNELQREANKEFHILDNLRFIQLLNNLSNEEISKLKVSLNNEYKLSRKKYLSILDTESHSELKSLVNNPNVPATIRKEALYRLENDVFSILDEKEILSKKELYNAENRYDHFIDDEIFNNYINNREEKEKYLNLREDRKKYLANLSEKEINLRRQRNKEQYLKNSEDGYLRNSKKWYLYEDDNDIENELI